MGRPYHRHEGQNITYQLIAKWWVSVDMGKQNPWKSQAQGKHVPTCRKISMNPHWVLMRKIGGTKTGERLSCWYKYGTGERHTHLPTCRDYSLKKRKALREKQQTEPWGPIPFWRGCNRIFWNWERFKRAEKKYGYQYLLWTLSEVSYLWMRSGKKLGTQRKRRNDEKNSPQSLWHTQLTWDYVWTRDAESPPCVMQHQPWNTE